MKYILFAALFMIPLYHATGEEKTCYVEDTNCREQKVNCREEYTNCKEKCVQERCFDFVEEGKKCLCIKKEKTDCKNSETVCDSEKVCDEKLVCPEEASTIQP